MSKVWFITGSSRGFGRELVGAALDTGDAVVATARCPEQLADLATTYGERILALPLDVTDAAAAAVSIAAARERFGRLDVVVQELLLRKLSDLGGIVISAREGENDMLNGESKDPSRKLVRVIMGAISEYDREMTVDRLAAGRQATYRCGWRV
jgi:NAD(P)-dependent dehydrogenase (short-subunit alcohol dehydrogenase family)